ncbi:MetQ/NlpA family ABC transporter substrate-binding protein [Methylobacterium sp. E-016]|uniref:MetQ/NlpA family ABC transporter substrate-binding protein n=1 Tax=Methylobacterium sp. E-016 TaxID=2836556 RepID=UPI002444A62A|nr:MetQ/NlpA family ABC transporter substrate-binding protein [Methylobacterium sp. E-016]
MKVIALSVTHAEILDFVQSKLAPDLALRLIKISSDIRPNRLILNDGADANFFQHVRYLRAEEKELGVRPCMWSRSGSTRCASARTPTCRQAPPSRFRTTARTPAAV